MDNKYIVIPVIEKELGDKTLHIGANIRKLREALRMTQGELGHWYAHAIPKSARSNGKSEC